MQTRWRHLKSNTGWGGLLRVGVGALLFGALAITMSVDENTPWPVAGFALGLVLPALFRRPLAANPGPAARVLHVCGIMLMGGAIVASVTRDSLWSSDHPMVWPSVVTLISFAGCYLSAFFWLFSDPEVVRLE